MVVVKYFSSFFNVEVVFGVDAPWQIDHVLEIVKLHTVLRTLWIVEFQLVEFAFKDGRYIVVPFFLGSFLAQLFHFR